MKVVLVYSLKALFIDCSRGLITKKIKESTLRFWNCACRCKYKKLRAKIGKQINYCAKAIRKEGWYSYPKKSAIRKLNLNFEYQPQINVELCLMSKKK